MLHAAFGYSPVSSIPTELKGSLLCQPTDVRLLVCDLLGNALPINNIHVTGNGHDYTPQFHDGRAALLPYGRYDMTVVVPGFNLWRRNVLVQNANVVIPAGLETGTAKILFP